MSLFSKIGSFIKPIAANVLKAVAPKAAEALKSVVGFGLDNLFQAGTSGLKNILGGIPLVGPFASGLVDKLAPGLKDLATNFFNGQIDKLLNLITQQPTTRPVPGTPPGTTVTVPPISTRGPEIIANTPNTGSQASTGTSGTSGTSGSSGTTASGGYPKYPEPLTGEDAKDLGKQNKYNADMMAYQQAFQAIQLNFQTQTTMMKASKDTISQMIRNFA